MDTGFLIKFFDNSREETGTVDDEQGTSVAHQEKMTTPVASAGETKRLFPRFK